MKKLLFVCGFPSGGTDLVKTMLNAHPDVYINGEMPFLKNIISQQYTHETVFSDIQEISSFQALLHRLDNWNNLENINHDFKKELKVSGALQFEEVLRICFSKHDRIIWGNKTPQNTENIPLLHLLFPNAYFLIITRDIRDVCLSWQKKWGKDILGCAAKWAIRMRDGWLATQNIPQNQYLFITFESLLSQPEIPCHKICEFLGVPFSERMLEHHKYTGKIIDGKINYGQAIKPENKAKWKKQLPFRTVKRIEEIGFQTMKLLGYEVEYASVERLISPLETCIAKWKDLWALLLVGNRMSRQNDFLHRLKDISFEIRKRFFYHL